MFNIEQCEKPATDWIVDPFTKQREAPHSEKQSK